MLTFLAVLQYLTLTFWIGSMAGFLLLFSPVLFQQLPSRSLAGGVSGPVLSRIDTTGLISSGILLVITLLQAINTGFGGLDLGRALLVVVMGLLTILGATTVRARMAAVRARLPAEIDAASPDDPNRREYGKWHGISMLVFTLVMLLGVLLIGLSALRYPMV